MQLQNDKKSAARSGFRLKVDKIAQDILNYQEEIKKYKDKAEEAKGHLERIGRELAGVDDRLKKLQPRKSLDRLNDRCKFADFRGML